MKIILLLTALSVSAIAAYYSIVGLAAIFAAAVIPIIVMGSALEVAKLVTVSFLHQKWDQTNLALKSYLVVAVTVLMFITSMGIFGYLSKAHIEQTATAGDNSNKIDRIQSSIDRENRAIGEATTVLAQLDGAVQTLMDYDRIRGDEGAIAVRNSQKEERAELSLIISQSESKIDKLLDEKLVLESEQQMIEAEVGPLKYIAELIYGANPNKQLLDEAVRWVIIIIVFVFDPLAVALLVAWNSLVLEDRNNKTKSFFSRFIPKETPNATVEIDGVTLTEKQLAGIMASRYEDLPEDQQRVYRRIKKGAGAKT